MSAKRDEERDEERVRLALAAIVDAINQRREAEHLEAIRIQRARDAGATWQEIAHRMGYRGRQGAHTRFQALLEREADNGSRE